MIIRTYTPVAVPFAAVMLVALMIVIAVPQLTLN